MTMIQHVDGDTSWLFLKPVSPAMIQELDQARREPYHASILNPGQDRPVDLSRRPTAII